jgi:hypothetical protein
MTGGDPPRISSPALVQCVHGPVRLGKTWGRYAGGTETTPRTIRRPAARPDRTCRTIDSHDTVGCGEGADRPTAPVSAASARAAIRAAIRMRVITVYTPETLGVPEQHGFTAGIEISPR